MREGADYRAAPVMTQPSPSHRNDVSRHSFAKISQYSPRDSKLTDVRRGARKVEEDDYPRRAGDALLQRPAPLDAPACRRGRCDLDAASRPAPALLGVSAEPTPGSHPLISRTAFAASCARPHRCHFPG